MEVDTRFKNCFTPAFEEIVSFYNLATIIENNIFKIIIDDSKISQITSESNKSMYSVEIT